MHDAWERGIVRSSDLALQECHAIALRDAWVAGLTSALSLAIPPANAGLGHRNELSVRECRAIYVGATF